MIAGCIDRMARGNCGGCERRDPCTSLFDFLGMRRQERPRQLHPFLDFLDNIAKAIDTNAKPRETPFAREVEQRVESLLASGPVRIEQVASAMGLSRQTLYRRLKAEGEGLAVKDVAYRLGFSDPAAFSRAFKRWTGTSPSGARG